MKVQEARHLASELVETHRRILKDKDKREIAQGWWTHLKRDITQLVLFAAASGAK